MSQFFYVVALHHRVTDAWHFKKTWRSHFKGSKCPWAFLPACLDIPPQHKYAPQQIITISQHSYWQMLTHHHVAERPQKWWMQQVENFL